MATSRSTITTKAAFEQQQPIHLSPHMKIKLLGISGKRFSGKDTFASFLVAKAKDKLGIDLRTYAFAAESKRMFAATEAEVDVERLLSNDREYKERWRPKLTEFTVRSINADPLVFCRSVADRIEQAAQPAIITDVRLKLEVEHLRPRFHFHLVRLTRSDEARRASGWVYSESADTHHTETELDDGTLWDEIVPNEGDLNDLAQRAEALISRWAT